MKVPLNWLRDYVELTVTPAELVERLTMAGLEVADIRVIGLPAPAGLRVKEETKRPVWDRDKIIIAEITSVEKHPNADRLSLPTVTWGPGLTKTLVTGAPNIKVGDKGQKVVLALTGSVLLDGHSEEKVLKELKPSKIRGVPSDSMVCSMRELGISEEHEGIILLEAEAPVGTPLADFMGDIVLDLDVLPNMARCLSMLGVAREVAAITGAKFNAPLCPYSGAPYSSDMSWTRREATLPAPLFPPGHGLGGEGATVHVTIADPKLCPRYAAALVSNVTIGPAPGWIQRRLLYAGMRPINNIVDVTNYVMLEWGQPLHAFDYDVIVKRASGQTPTITIRRATAGEVLITLDNNKRTLTAENLVIADTQGPIALAGVMGGLETEVTPTTKNILLESASFDFVSIRRTMNAFHLPSEASVRFSKGIHPETVQPAIERATELMCAHAGATKSPGFVDTYPAPLPPQVVELSLAQVERTLGMPFPQEAAVRILKALEYHIEVLGSDTIRATVPPHRLDVQAGVADVIEDLARIHGYDRLPSTLLADRLPRQQTNLPIQFEERLRDLLVGCGLQEAITYSLTMPEKEAALVKSGSYVTLKNPVSSERAVMRQSVLASVLEVAAANLRHASDIRLFEIGFVYLPRAGQSLPDEPRRLALVMTGKGRQEFWGETGEAAVLDFFDIKGVIEEVVADLHMADVTYRTDPVDYLHPGKSATLVIQGKRIGSFGMLHPKAAESYGLGGRTILVAELDVEALQAALPPRFAYSPVPRFPAALRDVAIVLPEATSAEKVAAEIRAAGGALLREARLFDLYKGESIPPGTKSLAYALTYQAEDRTLTDKEVDKAHKKIEDRLVHVLKAQIRGKE